MLKIDTIFRLLSRDVVVVLVEQGGVVRDGGRNEIEDGDGVEFSGDLEEFWFGPEDPERAAEEVGPEGNPPCVQLVALELRDKALEGCPPRAREKDRRRELA